MQPTTAIELVRPSMLEEHHSLSQSVTTSEKQLCAKIDIISVGSNRPHPGFLQATCCAPWFIVSVAMIAASCLTICTYLSDNFQDLSLSLR